MLRQSTKTDKELMEWYLDLSGAITGAYKLIEKSDMYMYQYMYNRHKVGIRPEQIATINKINKFSGIAKIVVHFEGNERVEDHVFPNTLNIYWDKSPEAIQLRRTRKINKVMYRMV